MWTTTETMGPSPEDRDREALLRLTVAALPQTIKASCPTREMEEVGRVCAMAAVAALEQIEWAVEARRADREDAEGSDDAS